MLNQKKIFIILLAAFAVFAVLYFITQRDPEPKATNETVDEVITIIKELDKNPVPQKK